MQFGQRDADGAQHGQAADDDLGRGRAAADLHEESTRLARD